MNSAVCRGLCCLILAMITGRAELSSQASRTLTVVDSDVDDRVVVVVRRGLKLGVPVASRLDIAAGQSGAMELGFVHSGYTARDPDGRQALLTVTLRAGRVELSPQDRDELRAKGIRLLEPATAQMRPTELDLTLEADRIEEARLRQALGLPRLLGSSAASIPLQIRWTNRDGSWLHRVLTAKDGLRFVLRTLVDISVPTGTTIDINRRALDEFLDERGSAPEVSWNGGRAALVLALADRGAFEWRIDDLRLTGPFPLQIDLNAVAGRVVPMANCDSRGECQASKQQLRDADWSRVIETSVTLAAASGSRLVPGRELAAQPKYVKDLSGSGVGLDALLGGTQPQ